MSLEFRKFTLSDVHHLSKWGKHEDLRYTPYHFDYHTAEDFKWWYYSKQRWFFRKLYGLFIDGYPVGFATLKNIHFFKRHAELGIAIDPQYIAQGYGTLLLEAYLKYVFTNYPLKAIRLHVAEFNKRAYALYKKVGFQPIDTVFQPFEDQSYLDLLLVKYPEDFHLIDDTLYTTYTLMEIQSTDTGLLLKNDL